MSCSYAHVSLFHLHSPQQITDESYRLSENALEEMRSLFAEYKGFHNFHNFTSGM